MSNRTSAKAKKKEVNKIKVKKECFLCGDIIPSNYNKHCKKCATKKKQEQQENKEKENCSKCPRCKFYKEEDQFIKVCKFKNCVACRIKHTEYQQNSTKNKKGAAVKDEDEDEDEGEEEEDDTKEPPKQTTPKKKYNILDYKEVILKIKAIYNITDDLNTIYKNIETKEEETTDAQE